MDRRFYVPTSWGEILVYEDEAIRSLNLYIATDRQNKKRKVVALNQEQALLLSPGSFSVTLRRPATMDDIVAMVNARESIQWPWSWGFVVAETDLDRWDKGRFLANGTTEYAGELYWLHHAYISKDITGVESISFGKQTQFLRPATAQDMIAAEKNGVKWPEGFGFSVVTDRPAYQTTSISEAIAHLPKVE